MLNHSWSLPIFLAILSCTACLAAEETMKNQKFGPGPGEPWRGVHLLIHNNNNVDALIAELPALAKLGMNVLVVEVDYNFAYKSHPEVASDNPITKKKARELAAACRKLNIRLIPQFQCLGHQSWKEHTNKLLVAHPEFDETPGQYPNNKGIYCRSWCPLHPKINDLVFDLFDELIDAFQADALHVGMDEVFLIGSRYCPRCKGKNPAKLFAKAVNDYYNHLVKKRHVEMLMWGDRLINAKALKYSGWEASTNLTWDAIDMVPKDIIICDWHYGKRKTYRSVDLFTSKGFRVWPSCWKNVEAAKAFAEYARNLNNPKVLGVLCTIWGATKIEHLAEFPPIAPVFEIWKTGREKP